MSFPYNTTVLMGVVEGAEFKTPAYLRDRFFSTVMTSTAKTIMFDKLPNGNRAMAPFINRRVGGTRIELKGYSTESFEAPVVGNHFNVTPEDGFMRAPGKTEYDLSGPRGFLDYQINKGLREIEDMISRREEWMCAQALLNGEIVFKGNGVDDVIQYWSQLDEGEQPKSSLATPWSDTSVDEMQIIDDLSTVVDKVVDKSGLTPRQIICGKNVYKTLWKKLAKSDLFDKRNVNAGNIAPADLPEGIRYMGYLAEPGIEIYSYVSKYEEDGVVKSIIPDDVCLFVSPKVQTVMAYGAIANGWTQDGAPNIVSGTRFSFERPHDSMEQGRSIFLQSSPLPVLQNVNGFHVLKAL